MKKHKFTFILFLAMTVNLVFGQIVTLDFQSDDAPTGDGQITLAEGWSVESGQPDLFCHGGGSGYGIPFTAQGYQDDPHCFAGLSDGDGISRNVDVPQGVYAVTILAKKAKPLPKNYITLTTESGEYHASVQNQGPWDVYTTTATFPDGESTVKISSPESSGFEYTFVKSISLAPAGTDQSQPETPARLWTKEGQYFTANTPASVVSLSSGRVHTLEKGEQIHLAGGMYYVSSLADGSREKISW